jgi:hypothetical protein
MMSFLLLALQMITLEWEASPSVGAKGYVLHYGFHSGYALQPYSIDVGPSLRGSVALNDLMDEGQKIYFTVTAYNERSEEGAPSNEATWIVHRRAESITLLPRPIPTPAPPQSLHVAND